MTARFLRDGLGGPGRFDRHAGHTFSSVRLSAFLALFLCMVFAPLVSAWADSDLPVENLTVITRSGDHLQFSVEIAATEDEREHGLMDRRVMPESNGMLFDFGSKRRVYMWMKDTLLPLDMLFIDEKGKIVTIKHDAVPMSEAIIDSRVPVLYVVELAGGVAKARKIVIGDRVESPTITKAKAN